MNYRITEKFAWAFMQDETQLTLYRPGGVGPHCVRDICLFAQSQPGLLPAICLEVGIESSRRAGVGVGGVKLSIPDRRDLYSISRRRKWQRHGRHSGTNSEQYVVILTRNKAHLEVIRHERK